MNSRHTWLWVIAAAGLFAFIFFFERQFHKPSTEPVVLLSDLKPESVSSVKVLLEGQQIRVQRANGIWRMAAPMDYPAQQTNINALLLILQRIAPMKHIHSDELQGRENVDEEFGFASPQASLVIEQPSSRVEILVGSKTPQGDGVFVEVVPSDGFFIVDADIMKFIPHLADDWRDTAFGEFARLAFDRVLTTNAGAVLELDRDPTNRLWRIGQPNPVRADNTKVADALQKVGDLQVLRFVNDDPKAEMDAYGLQPADLEFLLCQGTNSLLRLQFGKSPSNEANRVYARRSDRPGVVLVDKDQLAAWRGPYENFRDRHLVDGTTPLDRIGIHHGSDTFALERRGTNSWWVTPQNYPADTGYVNFLIDELTNMQVLDFTKDVVTTPVALANYGLVNPSIEYVLGSGVTNAAGSSTNLPLKLEFGVKDGKAYAQRSDETSVYGIDPTNYEGLYAESLDLRDHHIWSFASSDVAEIAAIQDGRTNEYVQARTNSWSMLGGITKDPEYRSFLLDEMVYRLGAMPVAKWVARGDADLVRCGFTTNSPEVTILLKNKQEYDVKFGGEAPSHDRYAAMKLGGETWIFEFSAPMFKDLMASLIPEQSP